MMKEWKKPDLEELSVSATKCYTPGCTTDCCTNPYQYSGHDECDEPEPPKPKKHHR